MHIIPEHTRTIFISPLTGKTQRFKLNIPKMFFQATKDDGFYYYPIINNRMCVSPFYNTSMAGKICLPYFPTKYNGDEQFVLNQLYNSAFQHSSIYNSFKNYLPTKSAIGENFIDVIACERFNQNRITIEEQLYFKFLRNWEKTGKIELIKQLC